eukprot:13389803-Alexandrium_andersonii.AAC.1
MVGEGSARSLRGEHLPQLRFGLGWESREKYAGRAFILRLLRASRLKALFGSGCDPRWHARICPARYVGCGLSFR